MKGVGLPPQGWETPEDLGWSLGKGGLETSAEYKTIQPTLRSSYFLQEN